MFIEIDESGDALRHEGHVVVGYWVRRLHGPPDGGRAPFRLASINISLLTEGNIQVIAT